MGNAGRIVRVIAALVLSGASHASATTYYQETVKCPIGGEKFKRMAVGSNSTFGTRLDGMPYSPLPIYPIPECPGNGFLIFQPDFTKAEVDRLTPLVASQEYQAMRVTETPHFRARWLMQAMEMETAVLLWMQLQASWESAGDWDRKARYLEEYIAQATGWNHASADPDEWFYHNAHAANALRELGRFEEAERLARKLDDDALLPDEDTDLARQYLHVVATLASEGNYVREPATWGPEYAVATRCERQEPIPLTASERPECEKPEILDMRKTVRDHMKDGQNSDI
jgi:hypothetical protein